MATVSGGKNLGAILAKITAKASNATSVEVGWRSGQTYADGTSLPLVAALNEFGVPAHNQPPRPFIRNTIAANSKKWVEVVESEFQRTGDAAQALGATGELMRSDLANSIYTFTDPPNAPSTIARKGFAAPLRDTGYMAQEIVSVVK